MDDPRAVQLRSILGNIAKNDATVASPSSSKSSQLRMRVQELEDELLVASSTLDSTPAKLHSKSTMMNPKYNSTGVSSSNQSRSISPPTLFSSSQSTCNCSVKDRETRSYRQGVEDTLAEVDSLRSEISHRTALLRAAERERDAYKEEAATSQRDATEWRAEARRARSSEILATASVDRLKSDLETLQVHNSFSESMAKSTIIVEQARAENFSLREERAILLSKISDLQRRHEEEITDKQRIKHENNSLSISLADATEQIKKLALETSEARESLGYSLLREKLLRDEFSKALHASRSTEHKKGNSQQYFEDTLNSIWEDVHTVSSAFLEVKAVLNNTINKEQQNLKNDITRVNSLLKSLHSDLIKARVTSDWERKQKEDCEQQLYLSEERCRQLSRHLELASSDGVMIAQKLLEDCKTQLTNVSSQLSAEMKLRHSVEEEIRSMKVHNKELEFQVQEALQNAVNAEKESEMWRSRIEVASDTMRRQREIMMKQEYPKFKDYVSEVDSLHRLLADRDSLISDLQQEIEKKRVVLSEANSIEKLMLLEIANVSSQNESLKNDYNRDLELEMELDRCRIKNTELNSHITEQATLVQQLQSKNADDLHDIERLSVDLADAQEARSLLMSKCNLLEEQLKDCIGNVHIRDTHITYLEHQLELTKSQVKNRELGENVEILDIFNLIDQFRKNDVLVNSEMSNSIENQVKDVIMCVNEVRQHLEDFNHDQLNERSEEIVMLSEVLNSELDCKIKLMLEIDSLKSELEEAYASMASMQSSQAALATMIDAKITLAGKVESLQIQNEELEERLSSIDNLKSTYENKELELKASLANIDIEKHSLLENLKLSREEIDVITSANRMLKSQLDSLESNLADLTTTLNNMEQQKVIFLELQKVSRDEIDRISVENQMLLKKQLDSLENTSSDLPVTFTIVERQKELHKACRDEIDRSNIENQILKNQLESMESKVSDLTTTLTTVDEEKKSLTERLQLFRKEIDRLTSENTILTNQVEAERRKDCQSSLEATKELARVVDDWKLLTQQLQDCREELETSKKKENELSHQVTQLEHDFEVLTTEVENISNGPSSCSHCLLSSEHMKIIISENNLLKSEILKARNETETASKISGVGVGCSNCVIWKRKRDRLKEELALMESELERAHEEHSREFIEREHERHSAKECRESLLQKLKTVQEEYQQLRNSTFQQIDKGNSDLSINHQYLSELEGMRAALVLAVAFITDSAVDGTTATLP